MLSEHEDDPRAVDKNRVKGKLKVTRAFGAAFMKEVSCLCNSSILQYSTVQALQCSTATALCSLYCIVQALKHSTIQALQYCRH